MAVKTKTRKFRKGKFNITPRHSEDDSLVNARIRFRGGLLGFFKPAYTFGIEIPSPICASHVAHYSKGNDKEEYLHLDASIEQLQNALKNGGDFNANYFLEKQDYVPVSTQAPKPHTKDLSNKLNKNQ